MLLKTKLTHALWKEAEKHDIGLDIRLQNICINGVKKGCSGHVVSKLTGGCVYLTTEEIGYTPLRGRSMYRLARDMNDWSSNGLKNGQNRWIETEDLAAAVINLLMTEKGTEK